MSKYQVKGLPWASGLGKDVSDCKTAKDVMIKAGLNFSVNKCELVAKMPFSLHGNNDVNENAGEFVHDSMIYRECPNAYATYRTDINVPLGIVKQQYEVVQNLDVFNFFDTAIGEGEAVWDKAGMFGYGHKLFVSAKLPIQTKVGDDPIDNYLVFSNSHDGSSSVNILFSPIRVYCLNMLNSAIRSSDSYIRFKHTRNVNDNIRRGAEVLKIACEHAKEAQKLYEGLLVTKMDDTAVKHYIASLGLPTGMYDVVNEHKWGVERLFDREYSIITECELSTKAVNKVVSIFNYYKEGVAQEHIKGTAWGAYNAITGYYTNVANTSGEKRVETLLWGSANKDMNNALNSAVSFARAV